MPAPQKCYDHLGKEYPSQIAMCKHYNVDRDLFKSRRKHKWSLQDALLKPKQGTNIKDHLGISFTSKLAMAEHYGIGYKTYQNRIDAGLSIEKALLTKPGQIENKECYDHLGYKYESPIDMCKQYGIDAKVYRHRIKDTNMSVEEALTTPLKGGKQPIVDHLGKTFSSITQMCKYHKRNISTYTRFRKQGFTIEQALTQPLKQIDLKTKRIGETAIATNGMTMTIVEHDTTKNISVLFENGMLRTNMSYPNFTIGQINTPKQYQTIKIGKMAYHVADKWAFYVKCEKCKLSDIMTYEQMQAHKCCNENT